MAGQAVPPQSERPGRELGPKRASWPWILAVLVLAPVLAWWAGYPLEVVPRDGWSTGVAMSFTAGEEPGIRYEQGFVELEAENVVILIGDGMGFGHVLAARAALAGVRGRLAMERLPVTGWLTTYPSGRLITDSAAAATALATGRKTVNRRVGTTPEGEPIASLTAAARERGKAIGLVTDSYMWDATPASFAAHVGDRREHEEVAAQMAASGFEVILGEEDPGLAADDDGGDVSASFASRGYQVVRRPEALADASGGPILALFETGAVDDPARPPELADLAAFALGRLAQDPDGFLLLVETEETDTAAHRHDFDRLVRGMAALDRAVEVVADFASRDRRTLVVVTADHETGGLSLLDGREGGPLKIRWATDGHTGNPVPLFAYGPGAEALGGARDNTEVPRILARLLRLELGDQGFP
jgi:alkaline phosphatase